MEEPNRATTPIPEIDPVDFGGPIGPNEGADQADIIAGMRFDSKENSGQQHESPMDVTKMKGKRRYWQRPGLGLELDGSDRPKKPKKQLHDYETGMFSLASMYCC